MDTVDRAGLGRTMQTQITHRQNMVSIWWKKQGKKGARAQEEEKHKERSTGTQW